MRRGEIWWGAPLLAGSVRKRQPFLIVSDDAFNANAAYPKVMVVHLTTVRRAGCSYAWEVELPRGVAGLPQSSIAKCSEVYTLFKLDLRERIGSVQREQMERVDRALALALGLAEPGGVS